MRTTLRESSEFKSDENKSLDWETIGRLVRERAWEEAARGLAGSATAAAGRSPIVFPVREKS